jgi:hypothetical protein
MDDQNKIMEPALAATANLRLKPLLASLFLASIFAIVGCGTPAAPAPPTLDLPQPVDDLAATRSGDVLTFTWSQPRRNTDKLFLKGDVDVLICQKLSEGECTPINEISAAPGSQKRIEVALPKPLATGEPRPATFAVQSRNHLGRAAGLSNEALVVAGSAPAPIEGLTVHEQRQGIVLQWKSSANEQTVRLIRHRISPVPSTQNKSNALAPAPEPETSTFLVDAGSNGRAVDRTAHVSESYEYRAERVMRLEVKGQTLELKSAPSEPVAINVLDGYAPERPRSVVAVAASSEAANTQKQNGIDISWEPSVESGLVSPTAGYIVYRREGEGKWERISGLGLVVGPGFHDASVLPGHTYTYSVSAVGLNTIESQRSEPASESVE